MCGFWYEAVCSCVKYTYLIFPPANSLLYFWEYRFSIYILYTYTYIYVCICKVLSKSSVLSSFLLFVFKLKLIYWDAIAYYMCIYGKSQWHARARILKI